MIQQIQPEFEVPSSFEGRIESNVLTRWLGSTVGTQLTRNEWGEKKTESFITLNLGLRYGNSTFKIGFSVGKSSRLNLNRSIVKRILI